MKDADRVAIVVREWVEKAESDLTVATAILTLGRRCPTDAVCFHAQQCVEKYLKAVLVLRGTPFPKTHDISRVMSLMAAADRPDLPSNDQDALTRYAAAIRYPTGGDPIALAEARRAVALARRARREVRKLLPRQSLIRKRA